MIFTNNPEALVAIRLQQGFLFKSNDVVKTSDKEVAYESNDTGKTRYPTNRTGLLFNERQTWNSYLRR